MSDIIIPHKSRDLSVLLAMVLSDLEQEEITGICWLIFTMSRNGVISPEEHLAISDYLYDNRPNRSKNRMYFWKEGSKPPRIKWLEKHIKLNQ